jgi:hypothetical protein
VHFSTRHLSFSQLYVGDFTDLAMTVTLPFHSLALSSLPSFLSVMVSSGADYRQEASLNLFILHKKLTAVDGFRNALKGLFHFLFALIRISSACHLQISVDGLKLRLRDLISVRTVHTLGWTLNFVEC